MQWRASTRQTIRTPTSNLLPQRQKVRTRSCGRRAWIDQASPKRSDRGIYQSHPVSGCESRPTKALGTPGMSAFTSNTSYSCLISSRPFGIVKPESGFFIHQESTSKRNKSLILTNLSKPITPQCFVSIEIGLQRLVTGDQVPA